MLTVSLRRTAGESGADAAVLERSHPAARAGDEDPVALAVELLGGPWKPLVAWQLFWGPRRFGELVRRTPGVHPKRLRRTLAELEKDGLVSKRTRSSATRRVEYVLSPFGESAKPWLATLYEWGLGALHARRDAARHPPPGPALERPWPREVPIHEEMS